MSSRIATLMHSFNYRCHYCGDAVVHMPGRPMTDKSATTDHCVPKARGGGGSADNTVLACARCNNVKNDMTTAEFMAFRETHKLPASYIASLEARLLLRLKGRITGTAMMVRAVAEPKAGFVLRGGYEVER